MAIDTDAYYRRYGPMVLRRCRRLLGDEQQAADAMQDTFVKLLRYEHRLEDEAPSSLLYRMATNTCLNRIRAQGRRPEVPGGEMLAHIAVSDESRLLSRLHLSRLFATERDSTATIAALHYVDGMTLAEVAREVNLSVSGVRKRLRRLKQQLEQVESLAAEKGTPHD